MFVTHFFQAVHDAEAVLELARKKAETSKETLAQVCRVFLPRSQSPLRGSRLRKKRKKTSGPRVGYFKLGRNMRKILFSQ